MKLCISQQIGLKAAEQLIGEVIQFGDWKPIPGVTPDLLLKRGAYKSTVNAARNILKPLNNFENTICSLPALPICFLIFMAPRIEKFRWISSGLSTSPDST
jgi:hypothetical protein